MLTSDGTCGDASVACTSVLEHQRLIRLLSINIKSALQCSLTCWRTAYSDLKRTFKTTTHWPLLWHVALTFVTVLPEKITYIKKHFCAQHLITQWNSGDYSKYLIVSFPELSTASHSLPQWVHLSSHTISMKLRRHEPSPWQLSQ